jgi:Uncharacterized protein conserved in bacteria (DUF2059)
MRKLLMIMAMALVTALPLRAQVAPEITQLTQALGLPGIVDVMREEGLDYGGELADNLFPGRSNGSWTQAVSNIYDRDRMQQVVTQVFMQSIQGQDIAALTAFFQGPLGKRIVTLEISARRALLDKSVEQSNKARTKAMLKNGGARVDLLAEFIDVNDMIEANVVGALNSNYAFFSGLSEGRAAADRRSESQILDAVRSDEDGIRQDVTDWLYEYLSMAYSPLSDAELQQYIDLSRTPAGQALNTALFASFDEMFLLISRELGQAASRVIASEDL